MQKRKYKQRDRQYLVLSEQTFPIIEQITAGMPGGFFIYHADGDEKPIYANRVLFRIYGCEGLEEFQKTPATPSPVWSTRRTWRRPSGASGGRWTAIWVSPLT